MTDLAAPVPDERRRLVDFLKPQVAVEPRSADPAASRYVRSYLIMRVLIGVVGVSLPFVLALCDGLLLDGNPFPRTSVSAYYYSGVRELFVGALIATGIFLLTYKVADRNLDNILSTVAGVAAITVALFPTARPEESAELRPPRPELTPLQDRLGESAVEVIHFIAAFTFIASLAVISYFFGKREGKRPVRIGQHRTREFWRNFHWACAGAIAAALVWVGITELADIGPNERLLYGEAVAALAFGASWLWKGLEWDMLRGRPAPVAEISNAGAASTE